MVRVLFVCLGNICRSPMAEGVFQQLVKARDWDDRFIIDSAGTSAYHIGELPDPRARSTMEAHGLTLTHRARQFVEEDFEAFDYILVMDDSNYENVLLVPGGEEHQDKVWMMRAFDEATPSSRTSSEVVPDPYYGGDDGFEQVHSLLVRTHNHLLDFIARREGWTE